MTLLPDMIIYIGNEGHKLSLQDPYTLDGVLINCIGVDRYNYTYNTTLQSSNIRIKNKNGQFITLSIDNLDNLIRNTVNRVLSQNCCNEIRVGESQRYRWTLRRSYNITEYIRDLEHQCDKINRFSISYNGICGASYENECMDRLYSQGRYTLTATSATNHNLNADYCISYNTDTSAESIDTLHELSTAISRTASSCDTLSSAMHNCVDSVDAFRYAYLNEWSPLSSQGVVKVKPEKKYIHDYNYKPEYIKYRMPDEDSSLLLGAEIEVDCGGESEEHAKKVLEIICGINPDNPKEALEDKMYCTHDGSLRAGIEFDTMPCSLEYHKKEMRYKEMFKYLDEYGYKAHDTTTCGLHIHADRSYLGKSELVQQLTISKILYILEKFNDEICVIARRNNSYSKFVGKSEVNQSLDKLYGKYNAEKYVALNLRHKESIEFRCFKGTLKYETFILTLEFVKNIIDYAKSINIEEIELIQWKDLMNTFSEELKEYYNNRLEKEKNKSDEKKENSNRTATITCSSVDWDVEYSRLYNSFSMLYDSFLTAASYYNSGSTSETEYTKVELKKKEIKTLKKKIKNSNNYMEKKQLNQELAKLNKELKKLKRQLAT